MRHIKEVRVRKKIFCPNEATILRTIPSLAKEIGDDESRVLLQMEFLTFGSKYFFENRYWIFKSIRDLHDEYFNFWSISKLHRVISKLTDSYNFLLVGNFKKRNQDNTNWYAIHYEMLAELKSIVIMEVSDESEGKRKQVFNNDKPPLKVFYEDDLFAVSQNGTPCPILNTTLSQNETANIQNETGLCQSGTPIDKTKQDSKKKEEEEKSSTSIVFEKKIEESSFTNRMLEGLVSSPVLNRNEAFQRFVNVIARIKRRELGQLAFYDSVNQYETKNLYSLVDQLQGDEKLLEMFLETMLVYQKEGKLNKYAELQRRLTKNTNPDFWRKANISAFYIVKFASDKEIIDYALKEEEVFQQDQKRKREFREFAKSPEAKAVIPIDPNFAKELEELKSKPPEMSPEDIKRQEDLQKFQAQISQGVRAKTPEEIQTEEAMRKEEMLKKMEEMR